MVVEESIRRALTLLERDVYGSGRSIIALYHAVPVSESSHKGICSVRSSSIPLTDGAREYYKGKRVTLESGPSWVG